MPTINIDLELEEVYDKLTYREKDELAEWLRDDISIKQFNYPTPTGVEDEDVVNSLNLLLKGRHLLSNEDRTLILKLAGKL